MELVSVNMINDLNLNINLRYTEEDDDGTCQITMCSLEHLEPVLLEEELQYLKKLIAIKIPDQDAKSPIYLPPIQLTLEEYYRQCQASVYLLRLLKYRVQDRLVVGSKLALKIHYLELSLAKDTLVTTMLHCILKRTIKLHL